MWWHVKMRQLNLKMCTKNLKHTFLWSDLCLSEVNCLIEVNSTFMQEKTAKFIFLLYFILLVHLN